MGVVVVSFVFSVLCLFGVALAVVVCGDCCCGIRCMCWFSLRNGPGSCRRCCALMLVQLRPRLRLSLLLLIVCLKLMCVFMLSLVSHLLLPQRPLALHVVQLLSEASQQQPQRK